MTDFGLKLVVVEDPNKLFPVEEIAKRIVAKNKNIIAEEKHYQENFDNRFNKVSGNNFSCMKIKDVDNTFYIQRDAINAAHGIISFNEGNNEFIDYITVLNGLSTDSIKEELVAEYTF